ncbi:helix-turn-helix domain-containing protein [Halalkalibacter flavus]|uniref:helix-turn-helix domain-containing protein n=1 Tax=Halalkalibacter flavus TaxID=3090668 RepID=UPI002FC98B2D
MFQICIIYCPKGMRTIANDLNICVSYLVRRFKNYTGSSPYQYLIEQRIQHSKSLLKTTNDSIENIAFSSGFNSAAHFITTLKKRTNLTPKEFRSLKL